jgi:glycosyltransferase involved in cell wall biosynthesis
MEAEADVLLLIQGGGFHMQVPSKAYEYLAMGRPILAITGDGATADLVRTSPIGRVVPPGDEEGIAAYLRERLTAPRPAGFAPRPRVSPATATAGRPASVSTI